jgi:bacteriorhodopsin
MIYTTGIISLFVQFVVGLIGLVGINIEVDPKDELLKDLLKVEFVVQIIEFTFYIWLLYYFKQISTNITVFRYVDWAFTTPMMLITLSGFLHSNGKKSPRLWNFISNHPGPIINIVLLNAAMLLCGLIGELGYLSPYVSTALGFIPFAINFKYIKDTFLHYSEDKVKNSIFNWFVFFWALYGVFALMNHTYKNAGYNILDIFSKNFFGVFLAYAIWSKSQTS